MQLEPGDAVLGLAMVFARVGGVFLIAPGLSSLRIATTVKVFLALSLSFTIAPSVLFDAAAVVSVRAPFEILRVLATETLIGVFIGLMARLLVMALETLAVGIANMVGLGGIPGISIDGTEPAQPAANLFMATAIVIIFLADLHHEILRALVGSYAVLGPGDPFSPQAALVAVADRAGEAFMVALRIAAPFIMYSVIINFAIGLTNKMTPQLPIFFVALPFVTAGGLLLIALSVREVFAAFADAFRQLTFAL